LLVPNLGLGRRSHETGASLVVDRVSGSFLSSIEARKSLLFFSRASFSPRFGRRAPVIDEVCADVDGNLFVP